MKGGISKTAVTAALVALLTLLLVACGGNDDDGGSKDESTTSSTQEAGSQSPEFEPAPLQVSGEGAELREAAEAVHAFFVTRARGEWSATCSQIAQALLEKLEGLARQSEQKSCAEFLESFTTPMSSEEWREVTVMDAESLDVSGEQATLAYRGAGDESYSVPLREEDGEWKMEALQGATSG